MRHLCYFASFLSALPCAVFALGIVALNHVIEVRNPFKIFYHFLLAFGWGVPFLAAFLIVMTIAGFFVHGRLVAAFILLMINLAALVIILMSPAAPQAIDELFFLLPAVFSACLAGFLVYDHFQAPAPGVAPAAIASSNTPS